MTKTLQEVLEEYSKIPEWPETGPTNIYSRTHFGDFPINVAATRGIVDEIVILLQAGANVNQKGEHGYTPLHSAVEQGHLEATIILLEAGAKTALKNDDGQTPIELSRLLGAKELEKLLSE
ncbi:ankyrin repeat domain-containing protein [Shimia sediminis]|uniref:ankyrin repeat domain-containing protein n=1 Tax=Shimia sediminis TaxID=2497945 RepID=UPI000F8EB6AF|nr:ankyrin repeat domain-containing protein [Shimia sediminis]